MKILQMTNISKSFFGVEVLHDVNFEAEEGEVHALLGENGAGKSTLMNILGGVYTKDSGNVEFNGNAMENVTVQAATKAGIAFVHQELNVINDLRVYENMFLNKEIANRLGTLNKKEMIKQAQELFNSLGVDIDPNEYVGNLDSGRKQLLEISKAFHSDAKLYILDEPTTALNNEEIAHLFSLVRNLKAQGNTFIFISHKMPEIFEIADRYTVFRNGSLISTGRIADTTPEEATKLMVGEGYINEEVYMEHELGEPVLEIENFSGDGFYDIDLKVKRGEVVGLTGLKGSGSSELLQGIFGAAHVTSGTMKVWGQPVKTGSIIRAMRHHIAMLPANRKENSVIPDMTILENVYSAEHCLSMKNQHISRRRELAKYDNLKNLLNIKANSPDDMLLSLSGGNQQKVIVGRWINTDAKILILDNPTQGIDVGAKAEIYKLIVELARQGITIIISTLEIPEIQKVADRCIVFYGGRIHATLPREKIDEHEVMMYATNTKAAQRAAAG
ncbi:MAG: sugar ABC transporter ATP-binding protein [Clostridiales Family XIII bacterium]|jgi:ribose transport system ATP-binding protein|nr:sugar ABC transporter ATP-binding protein [Clostridiales Family XIII bacterium]